MLGWYPPSGLRTRDSIEYLRNQLSEALGVGHDEETVASVNAYPPEPDPIWPDQTERPSRRYSFDDPYERRTEWAYAMVKTDGEDVGVTDLLAAIVALPGTYGKAAAACDAGPGRRASSRWPT